MPSNIDLTWAQSCRSIRLQLESEADRWCDNPGAAQAATIAEQDQTGRAILARSEIHISIYSTSLIKFHWWIANVKKLSTVTHRDSSSLPPFLQLLWINGNNKKNCTQLNFCFNFCPGANDPCHQTVPFMTACVLMARNQPCALGRIGFMGNFWSLGLKYQRHQSSRASPWVLGMRGSRICRSTVEYCLPHRVSLPIYTFSFLLCLCL